ncbi:MAG: hypothetical protein KA914_08080 [Ottowia sp.]|nr:hypothetical protein [Ottowia sp.]
MSYYSFFGAYTSSSTNSEDYLKGEAGTEIKFHGCSRSEAFQRACKALLDAVSGHELLRFLSDESAIHKVGTPGDVTLYTPITPSTAEQYVAQLNSLLLYCEPQPEELATLWFNYLGGESTEDVVSALNTSQTCEDLNKTYHGDDGDSSHFAISTLKTLRAAIRQACSSDLTLVYYAWQGT